MLSVGVNGYGTIGKRVADAVIAQPDMELAGVAKTRPNYEARSAVDRGLSLYAAIPDRADRFDDAGVSVEGDVDELIDVSDVMVDATPAGVGAEYRDRYADRDTPAIFQGGESPDVADESFTARANYDVTVGCDTVRVVSCNTTGLCRLLAPLREAYDIEKVRVTLVRRGGDPSQSGRGPINDILPNPVTLPSHHGPDVKTVLPEMPISTAGVKVPATLMHLHAVTVTFDGTPTPDEVRDLLADEHRLVVLPEELGIDGCGALKEFARDTARHRGDIPENCIWGESITADGDDLVLFQAIHQESIVVPENIDAIRAITNATDAETSRRRTDETLGIGWFDDPQTVEHRDDRDRYARDEQRSRYGNAR